MDTVKQSFYLPQYLANRVKKNLYQVKMHSMSEFITVVIAKETMERKEFKEFLTQIQCKYEIIPSVWQYEGGTRIFAGSRLDANEFKKIQWGEKKKVDVRIPVQLKEAAEKRAAEEGIGLNDWVCYMVIKEVLPCELAVNYRYFRDEQFRFHECYLNTGRYHSEDPRSKEPDQHTLLNFPKNKLYLKFYEYDNESYSGIPHEEFLKRALAGLDVSQKIIDKVTPEPRKFLR